MKVSDYIPSVRVGWGSNYVTLRNGQQRPADLEVKANVSPQWIGRFFTDDEISLFSVGLPRGWVSVARKERIQSFASEEQPDIVWWTNASVFSTEEQLYSALICIHFILFHLRECHHVEAASIRNKLVKHIGRGMYKNIALPLHIIDPNHRR